MLLLSRKKEEQIVLVDGSLPKREKLIFFAMHSIRIVMDFLLSKDRAQTNSLKKKILSLFNFPLAPSGALYVTNTATIIT